MNQVFVVCGVDLGWDCVVGVFKDVKYADLRKQFPSDSYVISTQQLETTLDNYKDSENEV